MGTWTAKVRGQVKVFGFRCAFKVTVYAPSGSSVRLIRHSQLLQNSPFRHMDCFNDRLFFIADGDDGIGDIRLFPLKVQ